MVTGRLFDGFVKRSLPIVVVAVFCWTLADHLWSIPLLDYPLLPGILTHQAIANPAAVNDTLSNQKIGFAAEVFVNLILYSVLAFAIGRFRSKAGTHTV